MDFNTLIKLVLAGSGAIHYYCNWGYGVTVGDNDFQPTLIADFIGYATKNPSIVKNRQFEAIMTHLARYTANWLYDKPVYDFARLTFDYEITFEDDPIGVQGYTIHWFAKNIATGKLKAALAELHQSLVLYEKETASELYYEYGYGRVVH